MESHSLFPAQSEELSLDGDSEEDRYIMPDDVESFKTDMLECLNAVESQGTFASSGKLSSVNPGLHVEGYGTFGLPLSKRDAAALIDASHRAPYGKGEATIVDEKVRKT